MSSISAKPQGIVYTFYSFKGGVGRTMALANVAALLVKWGHSVLVVDWDLEAPGLERFFCRDSQLASSVRASKPGIVDLIFGHRDGAEIDWQESMHRLPLNGQFVTVITSGRDDGHYASRLQSLDFGALFEEHDLGAYIERLRDAWISKFDFVLIDSRTGVTDIGGICTVHLADVLVLLFTSTDSSTLGAKDIIERARTAQGRMPVDRSRLLAVPVPSRDESRTEYERALKWKGIYAEQFGQFYADWLPPGIKPIDAIEMLKIPYVPYWSFGERLPVVEEGTNNPGTVGYSYQILARLLSTRLDWYQALDGQTLAPPQSASNPERDPSWLENHCSAAQLGIKRAGKLASVEIWHSNTSLGRRFDQKELLDAARQAEVRTSNWRPIGVVRDAEGDKPVSKNDGISAEINAPNFYGGTSYDYWALSKTGEFYTLMSLQSEEDANSAIFYDLRILRMAEALRHCANLYKALGTEPMAEVTFRVTFRGLRGRVLMESSSLLPTFPKTNSSEDRYAAEVTFRLSSLDMRLLEITMALCKGLFLLFDFEEFNENIYSGILSALAQ